MADYPTFRRNELGISDEEFSRLGPELKIQAYTQYNASRAGTNCVVFNMWLHAGEFISSSRKHLFCSFAGIPSI